MKPRLVEEKLIGGADAYAFGARAYDARAYASAGAYGADLYGARAYRSAYGAGAYGASAYRGALTRAYADPLYPGLAPLGPPDLYPLSKKLDSKAEAPVMEKVEEIISGPDEYAEKK